MSADPQGPGRLAGRVAIVTGASRGIGKAIAFAFGQEGAAVAVVARSEAQWDPRLPGTIHDTVAEIEAAGGTAVAVPADLAQPAEVDGIVERVHALLGPVSILVNNAALTVPGRPRPAGSEPASAARPAGDATPTQKPTRIGASFVDFPLKGFRQHFEVGLFAGYRLMQLALPDMIAAGSGSIVNISSVAGFIPGEGPYPLGTSSGLAAYGGNKAALHHLSQCVACEVQQYGIAVNVLSPSEPVITPGNLVAAAGETNWASPEEFAEATLRVALADPEVMNGQLLWSDDVLHPEHGHRGWLRPLV
ncbi:MAG: SDR family NAD(P)-dependent oxidoreductase [Actinomycetota bacterium]|nr:SDR family NAD(P)-dependent oxidoreductase [Actinomycetota bacterium]